MKKTKIDLDKLVVYDTVSRHCLGKMKKKKYKYYNEEKN